MDKVDFEKIIIPCLVHFSFVPTPMELDWNGKPMSKAFWLLSSSIYKEQAKGKDAIRGKCDVDAVYEVIQYFRTTYERLNNAKLRKMPQLELSYNKRDCCERCWKLNKSAIDTDIVLNEFLQAAPRFPHDTTLLETENITWCRAPFLLDVHQLRPDDDIEFQNWLVAQLKKD